MCLVFVVEEMCVNAHVFQLSALGRHADGRGIAPSTYEIDAARHTAQALQIAGDGGDTLEPFSIPGVHSSDDGRAAVRQSYQVKAVVVYVIAFLLKERDVSLENVAYVFLGEDATQATGANVQHDAVVQVFPDAIVELPVA